MLQLRHVLSVTNGATPESGEKEFWDGDIPWITPPDVSNLSGSLLRDTRRKITQAGYESCGTTLAPAGSIVLTKRAPIGELAILALEACANQGCFLLSPRRETDTRFYYHWLLTQVSLLQALGCGSTFMELSGDVLKSLKLPLLPLVEQRAIADYLDRETTRLDALVAAKERWLELLAEKRRALITRAVTRGLNPSAPLRDSGIAWLGQIPKHWRVNRLRWFITRLEQGWSPQAEDREPDDNDWAVLKLNAVNEGAFDDTKIKALPIGIERPESLEVHAGDFLVTRANTPKFVGDVCYVEQTRPRLILSDLIYRLKLDELALDGRFLNQFLLTPIGRSQIELDARGSSASMVKISQEHIKNWILPVPPLAEQRAIVAHIAAETAKIDALSQATQRTIDLLKERRAALIAAAVTGKLKIN